MGKTRTKFIHEGNYIAEIEVTLIYENDGWSPYLSLEEACKLDDIRECLRKGHLVAASKFAKIYDITPAVV